MRWPRAGIVVGVIGLVLLGAGWWLAGVGSAGPARHRSFQPVPGPLLRQLRQYLARPARAPVPVPRFGPGARGRVCFVAAGGFCSITPCVVPVATGPATACRAAPSSQAIEVRRP